ncbi:hypothetical protein AN478_08070 [Thiohalorhabdus denitrificans]|uniref:Uncharacterized protein n=1 Tax=Thiohalorhabdus denitrificans TaxID=381306 RepID=A0A0P9CTW0_9GAMM|nr:hypothetical protein [Thiohalorhabdus denitrificans]KPV40103.1 hypothetical protein AN478_08070 [Thiohalorhabdus denitrificans]SCY15681.1 hypothetical protein SAMN05661077_1380 [Thiohalorhabdus denitrificans]
MNHNAPAAILAIALLLAGPPALGKAGGEDARHGDAVRNNMKVQLLNPEAPRQDPTATPLDGPKAERVLENYRTEQNEADGERLLENMQGQ